MSWAVLDVAGRLAPIHWLHVLPEFEASRYPGRWSPFRPNTSIRYDPWVGETAVTANLRPSESRSPVQFSTDDLGYRLTPGLDRAGDVDLIFFEGDSYVYGGGLSDDETLPSVLTRAGLKTYNGAHPWWIPLKIDSLEWLIGRLGRGRRAAGAICWEGADFWPQNLQGQRPGEPGLRGYYDAAVANARYVRNFVQAALRISPLEVLSIRAFKWVANDVFLPNRHKETVEVRTMPDGRRILFTAEEIRRATEPPGEDSVVRNAQHFQQLAAYLRARNREFYVILLPNRYTVYGPLVDPTRPGRRSDYLDRLERELTRRHVDVFNAGPLLCGRAAEDLASGHLSYYREDHHWTAQGVRRVAEAFRRHLTDRQLQRAD